MSEQSDPTQSPAVQPEVRQHAGLSFFRPQNQDPTTAFYAPERDVALQGMRILGEVELLLRGERYKDFEPMITAMRTVWPNEGTDREIIDKAGMACLEYIADCWGLVYVPGSGRDAWPAAPKRLGPAEAISKLVNNAPKAGLMFIFTVSGYFLMDFYYMGVNQTLQTGLALDKSANQIYSMFDLMCRSYWFQKPFESQLLTDVRRSVEAAAQAGIGSGVLRAIVDKAVSDSVQI